MRSTINVFCVEIHFKIGIYKIYISCTFVHINALLGLICDFASREQLRIFPFLTAGPFMIDDKLSFEIISSFLTKKAIPGNGPPILLILFGTLSSLIMVSPS